MTSTPGRTGRPISSEADERRTEQSLTLAVVIPTLDEQIALPTLLASLREQTQPAERIVVSDAGSQDATTQLAGQGGAEVVLAPRRGRGSQIATALDRVKEQAVVIAHADMTLPPQALECIRRTLVEYPDCPGGCLGHRFDRRSPILRFIEWWDRRRARGGESYGDQAQFFRREWLPSAGGFPDQPIMEDVQLARRLRSLGKPLYLDIPVTVSARRFERLKWWRVVWMNAALRRRYRKQGLAACAKLYERYYRRPLS
jgi:glycosyltransferase involved in cell wall biosynthesis